jgi:hypothetical protein
VPDFGLKEYRRLMESHVPMYAHLEIGIALGLEAVQQQPEAAGQATAVDDAGGAQPVWRGQHRATATAPHKQDTLVTSPQLPGCFTVDQLSVAAALIDMLDHLLCRHSAWDH